MSRSRVVARKAGALRPGRILLALLAAGVALLAIVPTAGATQYQRPFKELFGPAAQPEFEWPTGMAVGHKTGDVLVFDRGQDAEQKVTFTGFTAGDQFTLGNLPAPPCNSSTSGAIEYTTSPESALAGAVGAKLKKECAAKTLGVFYVSGNPTDGLVVRFGEAVGESPRPLITCSVVPGHGSGGCTVESVNTGIASGIHRYHADGTPAPFAALGTDLIDGRGSQASCHYPPTPSPECDGTPQNRFEWSGSGGENQIAVDESSGPTAGDIYLTDNEGKLPTKVYLVDVFSPEGRYLGQLTSSSIGRITHAAGVAVDSRGALYVSGEFTAAGKNPVHGICKYIPTADHPTNADSQACFSLSGEGPIATGAGPSDGWLFAETGGDLQRVNEESGAYQRFFHLDENRNLPLAVDPLNGNPFAFINLTEAVELDGAAETAEAPLARLRVGSHISNQVAFDNSGDVYAAFGPKSQIFTYGEPTVVPAVTAGAATEVLTDAATLNGSVNPEGTDLSECFFEWGTKTSYGNIAPCEPGAGEIAADSKDHEVKAPISGLLPNDTTYHYRLAVKNTTDGTALEYSADEVLHTLSTVRTEAAEVTGTETATLKATVRPEGHGYTECVFEYGLAANQAAYEHTVPCEPEAGMIPVDSNPHEVKAQISGLSEATSYRFRITATNSEGTYEGEEESFDTFGPPRITAIRASDATQGAATLEAEIDPSGFDTSYRFEWGSAESYGNFAPASFESIGEGTDAVRVIAPISGLSTATTYHYRLVAESDAGEAETADQTLETLDACGLPDGRCFEMVSPRVPFPAEQPGSFGLSAAEIRYQAAEQPGALAYSAEVGEEDATRGAEVLYMGTRGPLEAGWSSAQLSPAITAPDRQSGTGAAPSVSLGFAKDLSCGVVAATQPLTDDPVAELIREGGGGNLYRRNPGGTYTLITDRPPEEPQRTVAGLGGEFELVGMSSDCSKVVFATTYHYAGVPGAKAGALYEWEAGSGLRYVGFVPKSSGGEEAVPATGGNQVTLFTTGNRLNAVSEDGSRVFFTATRKAGALLGEVGNAGVFAREGGTSTRDISASETAKASTGVEYQGATPDGQRVYFTAVAGIAKNGASSSGADLYEYDYAKPEGERLTDLSVAIGGKAEATSSVYGSLVGLSPDGSHVYFIARGQLVAGEGKTLAGNEAAGTFSLYDYERAAGSVNSGSVNYVTTVAGDARSLELLTVGDQAAHYSRVSSGGRYLLFQSTADITGYQSGGVPEAYLYDAEADRAASRIACLSCRPDGKPSVSLATRNKAFYRPLAGSLTNHRYEPQSLVMRGGVPVAFFVSQDALAPGAIEGQENLYEWAHGQVFLIAAEPADSIELEFAGASAEGTDLYFYDTAPLNWENPEGRPQAWDARVGGGFAAPSAPPPPCDPSVEGSCASGPGSQATVVPGPASATFNGPGNGRPKSHKPKKHRRHKKHHHKHKKHGKGKKHHHKHKKKQKRAKGDRRAGK